MAKQVIYRRGTTAEHANFVGANGEITVDTVKHVVIVHDGVTAGGFPLANASTITANISTLTANAANQAAAITVLQANAATQSNAIVALQSNAVVQQAAIDAFTLASNSTVIFANIAGVRANVEAANVQIGLLFGNATIQNEAIVLANANITALQSSITAANLAIASFVTGSGFANITQLTANITAVNSAISTQGVTFATNVAVAGVRANVTAANSAISSLQANIAAANVAINNIALSPSLIAEVTQAVTDANVAMQSYVDAVTTAWTANASTQATDINSLRANVTAANVAISSLQSNAATQAVAINTINANVIASNVDISSLQSNAGTQATDINSLRANITAANVAISSLQSNAGAQATDINSLRANVTAANSAIATLQTQIYANANVAGYLAGNISVGTITLTNGAVIRDTVGNAVAIGRNAGQTNQANNSIILNATGSALDQTTANTFTVAPVRNDTGNVSTALFYNTTTKEITTANIMLAAFTMSNHQQWTSNVSTIGTALNQLAARLKAAGL